MHIYKVTFIQTHLNSMVDKLSELKDFDYNYRYIESENEIEVETTQEHLDQLKKLDIITQEEYNKIQSEAVDFIYFY